MKIGTLEITKIQLKLISETKKPCQFKGYKCGKDIDDTSFFVLPIRFGNEFYEFDVVSRFDIKTEKYIIEFKKEI